MASKFNLKSWSKISPKKIAKKILRHKTYRRFFIGGCLLILFLTVAFFTFNLVYHDRILPKTYIGGKNFGGLNQSQAAKELDQLIDKNENSSLNYTFGDKSYQLTTKDLQVDYASGKDKTVNNLLACGRRGTLGKVIMENLRSIFSQNRLQAEFSFNQEILNNYLMGMAKDIDIDEQDATIKIVDGQPEVVPEKTGRKFEITDNRQLILQTIGSFSYPANLPLVVNKILPKIDQVTAEQALPETRALLGRSLVMTAAGKSFNLTSQNMAEMLEFVATLSQNPLDSNNRRLLTKIYILKPEISNSKVNDFAGRIAQAIFQEPKDPQFQVSGGRVTSFGIAQTGYQLEQEQAVQMIIEALKKDQKTVDLPVKVTESTLSSADPKEIGLKELVGQGDSSWRGSPSNRIYNIKLGAEKISGTIVMPGQEFSTLKTIGHVGPSTGFLPELVIKNSTQVEPDYGGGLCQVSTTLFRAALYSGLEVTARTPHSFRVSYYEPPVGMDATIFDPAPDFKFVNNLSTPILIWAIAGNNSLSFQIYGTKDGRKVEISDPSVYNYISPGSDVYTESSSMAAGEIRQVERATSGATASFHYKVTSVSGQVLQDETLVSKYVPLPNSYLYGPGTPDIPGQEQSPAPTSESVSPTPTPTPTPTIQGETKIKQ